MKQHVNLITLGVEDLARARGFYEALGWTTRAEPDDDVVFFQAGDMVVALWDRARLAEDSSVEDDGGWGGVTLALNFGSPQEVDAVIEEARAPAQGSAASRRKLFGAAIAASSSTPRATRGRSPTTRIGPSPRTGAFASAEPARSDRLAGQPGPPASR
jgi:predicted lactoylglutathione lyase